MMHRARGWINNKIVNDKIVNVMLNYNNPKTDIQELELLKGLCVGSPKMPQQAEEDLPDNV